MPETQYALVSGDQIITDRNGEMVISGYESARPVGYSAAYPEGCRWLPIENVDSQPFELARHWRDAPRYVIGDDRVQRIYDVREIRQRAS